MIGRCSLALSFILAMAGPAMAGPGLRDSADAPPLRAWAEFCNRQPAECTIDVSQPETIPLTQRLKALLAAVNLGVNRSLRPITDQEHWGVADLWSYPDDGSGDCEDYQLLKRRLLIQAGLPRRALLMAVVSDENGEGHAVLTVRTDRGDFILDNKRDEVVEWFETPYTYIKRESATPEAGNVKWVFLAPAMGGAPLASAAR